MERIRSVLELADRYDALVCDVWGVLHDGRSVFPGVVELLGELRARGLVVVLLSNASRPSRIIPAVLQRVGLPDDAWDAVVTSGDVTRTELARRAPGPVHRIGRDTDAALWEGLGLEFAELNRARFVAMAGLRRDEQPEDYLPVLRKARARDLELLIANPDVQVQHGDRMAWCPGAVARVYAGLGGKVVQAGKPFAPIYDRALAEVDRAAHRAVRRERILAVGDGIGTDIVGANRVGLDSLFIATGINGDALLGDGQVDVERAGAALEAARARARYVMTAFA
ncbi:MAG: TIGR01459 family HAD-type hydrolase [Candidatus Nanopelagicales bacterium]|nr:TIGR01459 family HAD-type hydrolase [Candidatus Nanopelagicales bacterium]